MSDSGNVGGAGGRQVGPMVSFTSEPVPVEPAQDDDVIAKAEANLLVVEEALTRIDTEAIGAARMNVRALAAMSARAERAEAALARVAKLCEKMDREAARRLVKAGLDLYPALIESTAIRAALSGPSDTEEQT